MKVAGKKLTPEQLARQREVYGDGSQFLLDTPEKQAAHKKTFEANAAKWEAMTPAQQEARMAESRAKQASQMDYIMNGTKQDMGGGVTRTIKLNPDGTQNGARGIIGAALGDGAQGNWGSAISQLAQGGGIGQYLGQGVNVRNAGVVSSALRSLADNGVKGMQERAQSTAAQSMMSRYMDGPQVKPDEDLPIGPGFAYLNHLFNNAGGGKKIKERMKDKMLNGLGIMTNAMDGVRTALKLIGAAGDDNIDGLPIDTKDIMKIFHGDKADDMDDIQRNEFLKEISDGTKKIDRKKIRKFVNMDGSLTWEILNDDKKTIMSRFTFGEYNGTKLFAQGGYKQFGELLREARQKLGPDARGEFDSIRQYRG